MSDKPRHRTDGDGWVECSCGQRHWGLYGSAGLLLVNDKSQVLLQHRAPWSHFGGTWGMPGGARAANEAAVPAALREASEEAAVPPGFVDPSHTWVNDHDDWSYTTVVGTPTSEFMPYASDAESVEVRWIPIDEVDDYSLLPAFGDWWPSLRKELGRRLFLIVDAANVVGSRPDGWWRDRVGAAKRLRDLLGRLSSIPASSFDLPAHAWFPTISMVVEGKARGVAPIDGVDVVSAVRDGDAAIVDTVATARLQRPDDYIVVITADRELRDRVSRAGGRSFGPSALYALLPA